MRRFIIVAAIAMAVLVPAAAAGRVLRVGSYRGIRGQFRSLQAAVDAARPGDWVLVGPGDYKTRSIRRPRGGREFPAGLLITTPQLRVRAMNRRRVVIDGTRRGPVCSRHASDQNYGLRALRGHTGINGVMVWKADDVWLENLTACNFLAGPGGDAGNVIWWNGGDGSGRIGGWGFRGAYLTATTTFYRDATTPAAYGLYSSNWSGGRWDHVYASNFNDSDFHIGACQRQCNQTVDHAWAQYSALGYSGTNSGGRLVIENSEFDHNEAGFDSNSQNNSDWPSPQDGSCPGHRVSDITHTHSCWVFMHNNVHDNNNPDVPSTGAAAAAPVGTGVSIEGRDDTIMHNVFRNNGAWGTVFQPYPDTETPPPQARPCVGGTSDYVFGGVTIRCVYDDWGNALIGNTFIHNGFFANPTNGDFAESTLLPGHPINCYRGNIELGGTLRSSPANLEATNGRCGTIARVANENLPFILEALCDSQVFGPGTFCSPGSGYPRRTRVTMHPLPKTLPTMPNPCRDVPANPWCPTRRSGLG